MSSPEDSNQTRKDAAETMRLPYNGRVWEFIYTETSRVESQS